MDFLVPIKRLGPLFFLVLSLWACDDILDTSDYEFEDIEATPTMALPLAFADMSIRELLQSADSLNIKVYPDGLVYLEYDQTLRDQSLIDLIDIPNKNVSSNPLAVPAGSMPPVTSDFNAAQDTRVETFNISPEQLTELLLKQGQLAYDITLTPPNPNLNYAVNITIPELTVAGSSTVFSQEVAGLGLLDLSGYVYSSPVPNQISVTFTLIIKQNPNTVNIGAGTVVTADILFRDLEYGYAKGDFGTRPPIDLPAERIDVSAFGTALSNGATVSFADPSLSFTVINDIGVPTLVTFAALEARKQGSTLPIQTTPANPFDIAHPTVMGNSATTTIQVDNAKALLDFVPTNFFYKASAEINHASLPMDRNNFITDTSSLKINMHVEVPLYGHAYDIVLSDTVDLDLSDEDDSNIESAFLRVSAFNEMPLDANIQLLLTDESYTPIASLVPVDRTLLIKSSTVNGSGDLLSAGVVDELIPIDRDNIQKIFQADYIIIRAQVATTKDSGASYPDVKFKADYRMDVKLGLQAKLKLTIGL